MPQTAPSDGKKTPGLSKDGSPRLTGFLGILDTVSESVALHAATSREDAVRLLSTDPELMHQSVAMLNVQGAFKDSALQTAYVGQCLAAASRHGARFFEQPPVEALPSLGNIVQPLQDAPGNLPNPPADGNPPISRALRGRKMLICLITCAKSALNPGVKRMLGRLP